MCYLRRPVRAFSLLVGLFLLAVGLVAGGVARAGEPDSLRTQAELLERESAELGQAARAALLELYALETSLGRAERRVGAIRERLAGLEDEERTARRSLEIARGAERVAQRQLGDRITALYVEGDTDPLEVLLGASSLDDVITAVDGLTRLAEEDERIIAQARGTKTSLRAAMRDLARREAELRESVAAAEAARSSLASARDDKAAYVASLRRRRELNDREIRVLAGQAAAAEEQSAAIEAEAVATSPASSGPLPPPAVADATGATAAAPDAGGRMLTVDAVAYSLPGYTASGLPVGKGVVAVDPAVIPLGTRLYVPGYGPAIAADVGSAIKGLIIDLWFPTYDQAAAWGRRTVTITVYG